MPIETNTATSLVCPNCKKETGVTKEFILDTTPLKDFYCPHCKKLVFSCKPVIEKFTYTYGEWSGCGDD